MIGGLWQACDSESGTPNDPAKDPIGKTEALPEMLRPMLTDGKKWTKEITTYNSDYTPKTKEIFTEEIVGDTVVLGLDAKVTRCRDQDGEYTTGSVVFREEGNKIYKLWQTRHDPTGNHTYEFKLYCDVFPEQGSTWLTLFDITVISRGTITLMGKQRRAAKVWTGCYFYENTPYDYWVEGIGPLFYITSNYNSTLPSAPLHVWSGHCKLLECYDGDEKIYDCNEFSEDLYTPLEVFSEADRE